MKHLLLFTILLFCTSIVPAQNLPDTLNWLQEKLQANKSVKFNDSTVKSIDPVRFNSCDVAWREYLTIAGMSVGKEISLNLKSIQSLKTSENAVYKGIWDVEFTSIKDGIKTEVLGRQPQILTSAATIISVSDQESANKLKSGFTRAVELCKEQKDLF